MSSCDNMPVNGSSQIQIVIADRHSLFRSALAELVARRLHGARVSELSSTETLHELVSISAAHVLMIDLQIPGLGGPAGLRQLANTHPGARIIALCDDLPESPQQLFMHGAMAGISKSASSDQFIEAILAVQNDQCWLPTGNLDTPFCDLQTRTGLTERVARLSPRRQLIVEMLADGQLNKQIAYVLNLRESTIKGHVSKIMKALNLRNRTQIAAAINHMRGRQAGPLLTTQP